MEHTVKGLVMKAYKTGRQVVDWSKVVELVVDGHEVKVVSNAMVTKVSKNGKERKERRLEVTIDGVNIIEVGTESVKKGSFIKRLLKITKKEQNQESLLILGDFLDMDLGLDDVDTYSFELEVDGDYIDIIKQA